jgi:predicted ATPase/transcriptional regulator with XRE-family HTH domain
MGTLEVESFASRLRRFRIAAGLSQEMLAERAQLSRDGIAALERGRRSAPHPQTVARLADALGLEATERQELFASATGTSARKTSPAVSRTEAAGTTEPSAPPTNLPGSLSSFVGRRVDILRLSGLLLEADGGVRIVTLVGPGGVGKTRLALEFGRGLSASAAQQASGLFPDGIWLAELAGVTDANLIASVLAAALDVREQPGQPALTTLTDVVAARRMLIVLDNCEHLIDACASVVVTLLERCPGLQVLATSREALGVPGEVIWPVLPLALPAREVEPGVCDASASEALQLFESRARLVQPGFTITPDNAEVAATVCRQLDGIPLAIELAAARVSAMDLHTIADGLADRFQFLTGPRRAASKRQQTLLASVEWSYNLLSPEERCVFNRLSVFAGGWSPEDVEPVADVETSDAPSLVVLARLVDKSLVLAGQDGGTRYRMLETLRRFAVEQLEQSGQDELVRARHAHHFLRWLEWAESRIEGPDQREWLDRIEQNLDNIRVALDWCCEVDDAESGLRVAWGLALLAWLRGYLNEVDTRLGSLLALQSAERAPAAPRASAYVSAGFVAFYRGEVPRAERLIVTGLTLFRELDESSGIGQALTWLGLVLTSKDQFAAACDAFREAEVRFDNIDDAFALARVETNFGRTLNRMGEYDEATIHLDRALHLRRSVGDARGVANTLTHMVDGLLARGEDAGIHDLLQEALTIARQIGDRFVALLALVRLGRHSYYVGDLVAAREHLFEALAVAQRGGWGYETAKITSLLGLIARDDGELDEARARAEDALRRAQAGARQPEVAFANYLLGDIASLQGHVEEGRAYLAASVQAYLRLGRSREPTVEVALAGARLASVQPVSWRNARLAGAADAVRTATRKKRGTLEWRELARAVEYARVLRADPELAAAWDRSDRSELAACAADALMAAQMSA